MCNPSNCVFLQVISVMPQSSKGKHISTIDQLTSAFLVFAAVYTQRFPHSAPGMFKYCKVVGILPRRVRCLHGVNMTSNFATFDTQTWKASPGISPGGTCFLKVCQASPRGQVVLQPLYHPSQPVTISPFPQVTAGDTKFKHVCAK